MPSALEALRELVAAHEACDLAWMDLTDSDTVPTEEWMQFRDDCAEADMRLDLAWEQARRVIEEESDGRQ